MKSKLNERIIKNELRIQGEYTAHRFYVEVPVGRIRSTEGGSACKNFVAGKTYVVEPGASVDPVPGFMGAISLPTILYTHAICPGTREFTSADPHPTPLSYTFLCTKSFTLEEVPYACRIVVDSVLYKGL